MRVSKAQQEKNRERVTAAAAKLLRERGIDGIGVDALAKAAGMTHGAIYSHFRDKDDLAAAALSRSLEEVAAQWRADAAKQGQIGSPEYFNWLVRAYVSRAHRDRPGEGCAISAIGTEAVRQRGKVRRAFSDRVETMINDMTEASDGASEDARRESAIATVCTMLGAVILSRATEDAALSDKILATARKRLMKRV